MDQHLDLVAQAVGAPTALAGKGSAREVQLEVVARQAANRQVALKDIAEADEETRLDHANDLALPRICPSAREHPILEQPREADVVGRVLKLPRATFDKRQVFGEATEIVRESVVGLPQFAQQRAMDDEVGIATDR